MADGEKGKAEMKQGSLTVKNPNGKTYRIPASRAGSVRMECSRIRPFYTGTLLTDWGLMKIWDHRKNLLNC